eukprot:CAMPEP_0178731388 /NCGR_PEP_ID=MMETSP0699-20121125/30013_1 /TAXON_ID=265572 /ORGANISM="Extubocellulus spinifer, Strain CCMP396" /LENGTH=103 /DNA_ID=CAMNT_0020383451 /DNA_START=105 /DNA_END=416 /DNA_ORIENTATION=+
MALGPLARVAAQLVVAGIAVLSRALPAAYAQALNNAKKGGGAAAAAKDGGFMARKVMARDEALSVLNLNEAEVTAEAVQKVRRTGRRHACMCFGNELSCPFVV